jgi:putative membrane protein
MSRSVKVLLGVLGAAVVVLVVLPVFFAGSSGLFGSGSMMGQGGMMDGGWGVFGMAWMMVGMIFGPLLLLGGIIAVIVWAVTQLGSGGHASPERHVASSTGVHEQSAEEVLRQRFARGEIDAEEYEERHRVLRKESPAAHR